MRKLSKVLVLVVVSFIDLVHCKSLPSYLKKFQCKKSDGDYSKCVRTSFENTRDIMLKGISELGLPPGDPFELPFMKVNRTVNELVKINAVCKDIKVTGARNAIIEDLKADPINHYGEIRVTLPFTHLEMDYDVTGQLLVVPLISKGHFEGNFTNTQIFVKGSLKTNINKDNVEYFRVNKINSKITVGDGKIKLTSKDKDMQYAADLIANFFNSNQRRVMDAVNPIFVETSNEMFRVVADQILATLPAKEWLPE